MNCTLEDTALKHFNWVRNIILSCRDTFQIETAKTVIKLFDEKYKDDTLTTELYIAYQHQFNRIHSILN